jgi:hypothetical protein
MKAIPIEAGGQRRRGNVNVKLNRFLCLAGFTVLFWLLYKPNFYHRTPAQVLSSKRQYIQDQCKYIKTPAGPPPNFYARRQSDRFVPGTKPVLLRNAKLWTGARNGTEIVFGDVFFDKGIIKAVGYIPHDILSTIGEEELVVRDLDGACVTPGLVDLHSHLGVDSSPALRGMCLTCTHLQAGDQSTA